LEQPESGSRIGWATKSCVNEQPSSSECLAAWALAAPADDVNRWMGSIAQDKKGNMGLGYSVSSETVYPGIRYTGRLRNHVATGCPRVRA
jgi:hypothetical protein